MSGNTLPDDLDLLDLVLVSPRPIYVIIDGVPTTTPRPTTQPTLPPGYHRWMEFDGSKWVLYILNQLPDYYLQRNHEEGVEITFETNEPDGLIWFTGNERDNMHLTLRVCRDNGYSYTANTGCDRLLKPLLRPLLRLVAVPIAPTIRCMQS